MEKVLFAALLGVEDSEARPFCDELAAKGAEGVGQCEINGIFFLREGERVLLRRLLERLVVIGVSIGVEGTVSLLGLGLASMVGDVVSLARRV